MSTAKHMRVLTVDDHPILREGIAAMLGAGFWGGAIFFVLLIACTLHAQMHTLEASQYLHTSWTSQQGFFKGGIVSITQTSDGYLWLSSTGGIIRFDCSRFFSWKPPSGGSLPRPPLRRLLGSSDGSLWIAGAGLAELKAGGELRRYHQLDSMDISELIEDKDGAIWAGGDATTRQSPKLCRVYRGES